MLKLTRSSKPVEKYVQTHILSNWPRLKNRDVFPGPQPVSIERADMFKLEKYKYYLGEKSDGDRYLFVTVSCGDISNDCCFLVDRKFFVYPLRVEDCTEIQSTIYDGEVVIEDDKTVSYIIHDCICAMGENVAMKNLDIRLTKLKSVLGTSLHPRPIGLNLKIKKFWNLCDISEFLEELSKTSHTTDGIIFTPVGLPIESGTQYSLFKWKKPENHTIDFHVNISERRIILSLQQSGSLTKYKVLNTKQHSGKKFFEELQSILPDIPLSKESIIECKVINGNYKPFRLREDKAYPNSIKTCSKTLLNIEENITIQDLVISLSK